MSSSGNFPVWTDLVKGATNITKGGTRFDGSTNSRSAVIPFQVPTGTKFYVECLVTQATNYNIVFGLVNPYQDIATYIEDQSTVNGMIFHGYGAGDWRTNPLVNGSRQGFNALDDDSTANRVLAMTINRVDNEIKMYIDNALITNGTISISATQEYVIFASFTGGTASGVHMNINCGHDSTGAGTFSAASNADENGFGEFQYSPPTGFLAICSANLPTSTGIDPAETDDDIPTKQFNVLTYTGNNSTNAITGLGFKPDFCWIKKTNSTGGAALVNSTVGGQKVIQSNANDVEGSTSPFQSFDNDGFTLDNTSSYLGNFNGNTDSYVAWCWRATGGTTATNTSGTITTTVQANQAAGFSIITYTGNDGSWGSGNRDTIGHGLSAAPEFMIFKERNANDQWTVFHHSVGAGGGTTAAHNNLVLATDAQLYTNQSYKAFGGVMPTSTVITVEGNTTNLSTSNHVAYVWHSVAGFSKFGAYEGNSNADGPFVYTGFRPRLIFVKLVDSAGDWWVEDTERDTYNPLTTYIAWNRTDANATGIDVDVLASGFKIRSSSGDFNSDTVVYGAWGDVPSKYNNAF